ncbi:hypothetical protein C8R48DRAFT_677009 [Suillus tomentosus]|nr:hypothetical protein C8R48DRAFT_677009 [Suillus tomentosus]
MASKVHPVILLQSLECTCSCSCITRNSGTVGRRSNELLDELEFQSRVSCLQCLLKSILAYTYMTAGTKMGRPSGQRYLVAEGDDKVRGGKMDVLACGILGAFRKSQIYTIGMIIINSAGQEACNGETRNTNTLLTHFQIFTKSFGNLVEVVVTSTLE